MLRVIIACVILATPALAADRSGAPVYGWDARCDGSARYQAMSEGFNCNAARGDTKSRPYWCATYLPAVATCAGLRALVKVKGEASVTRSARTCGATEDQIEAKRQECK